MNIEIKNLRNHEFHNEPWQFRVDRGTPVGNPYYMHDESERDAVCNKYELHFKWLLVHSDQAKEYLNSMLDALKQYGHIELYCWCAPKRCHARTIRGWLNAQIKNS